MRTATRLHALARWPGRLMALLPAGRRLPPQAFQVRHRGILVLLVVLAAGVPIVSLARGQSLLHGAIDSAPSVLFAALAFFAQGHRRWAPVLATVGLMISAGAYVHLTEGLTESHFLFFVLLGVVSLYQDWLTYLTALAAVVIHHGVLGVIDPLNVYNHPAAIASPVKWALIHAGFVCAASVASIVAWRANEQLAVRDPLTKLPNRRLLTEYLDSALSTSATNAVLFIDLCGFKLVNDTLGHEAGDEVLACIAERIHRGIRAADHVGRFGGDEFVVVLVDVSEAAACLVAERLLREVSAPITVGKSDLCVAASIGIAMSGTDGDTTSLLLRNADVAMYAAKRVGDGAGGVARFATAMGEAAAARLVLEADLRSAVERGELRLHYQPIVAMRDQQVLGAEALVRWEHPTRGFLSPAEFIPLAEQTGTIVPIGTWILKEACAAASRWPVLPDGRRRTVSVNISARQVVDGTLVDTVAAALASSGLHPSALCLEITESLLMHDPEGSAAVLCALKRLGVRLAVDDFGTGYSSLARLKTFPLDYLKIDRSFVDGLPSDSDDQAIVTSIVSLAHVMGMAVVAEGVETTGQFEVLRRLRCEEGQGWLWSKARPEPGFLEWLTGHEPSCPELERPVQPAAARRELPRDARRVLVVDDDPRQVELSRLLLGESGYEVIAVTEPAQFLATLTEVRPDLVLMDLRIAGRSGLDLVQDMADAGHDAIVVAVSAHTDWLSRPLHGADGFAGVISKPIDPEAFADQVEAYLAGTQAARPAGVA